MEAYFKYFPISLPEEDQNDRNALYCLSVLIEPTCIEPQPTNFKVAPTLVCSSLYPGNLGFRKICVEVMEYLTEKYIDGYEGWAKARDEEIVSK